MQSPAARALQAELRRSSGAKKRAIRMTKRNGIQQFLNRSTSPEANRLQLSFK